MKRRPVKQFTGCCAFRYSGAIFGALPTALLCFLAGCRGRQPLQSAGMFLISFFRPRYSYRRKHTVGGRPPGRPVKQHNSGLCSVNQPCRVILSEAKDLAKRRILRSEGSCEAKDLSRITLKKQRVLRNSQHPLFIRYFIRAAVRRSGQAALRGRRGSRRRTCRSRTRTRPSE